MVPIFWVSGFDMIFNRKTGRESVIVWIICGLGMITMIPEFAHGAKWQGNLSPFIGFDVLDNHVWGGTFTNGEIGLISDFREASWPFSIGADVLFSRGNQFFFSKVGGYKSKPGFGNEAVKEEGYYGRLEVRMAEMDIGPRKIWENFRVFRPFVDGGLAIVHAEGEISYDLGDIVHEGTGTGIWVGGGNYFKFGNRLNIGIDYRFSYVKLEMSPGNQVNVGGHHVRFMMGRHW